VTPVLKVFVARATYDSDLANVGAGTSPLEGADRLCTYAAESAQLGGTWKAWLSSSGSGGANAISRMADAGPWYQEVSDGGRTLTFADLNALATLPATPLGIDERGAPITATYWTATQVGGTITNADCFAWAFPISTFSATVGATGKVDAGWTSSGSATCDLMRNLLCVEQDLAPAAAAAPNAKKRIFMTSQFHNGKFADAGTPAASAFTEADTFCTQAALAAGKNGTWVAWLSVSTTPALSRLPADGGPWYQESPDGGLTLTFTNRANLATVPLVPMSLDEFGVSLGGSTPYWTGTRAGGQLGSNCGDFTGTGSSVVGRPSEVRSNWTEDSTFSCGSTLRLLCLEL
jgi:hypothetical protein